MDANTIFHLIKNGLPDAEISVEGEDGVHFSATVISASFQGLSTLQQHRTVYATLGHRLGGEIHALQLTTGLPETHT